MKESSIRPAELFNKYLELSRQDIDRFFIDRREFREVSCPACGGERSEPGLEKFGFTYLICSACGSLYLSPRPSPESLNRYYRESEAVKYWCTHFYKETAQSRREKMFRPRAGLAAGIADRFGLARASAFADIGAGYGIFLEEVERLGRFGEIIAVEPSPQLADKCRERGFKVIQKTIEEISAGEVSVAFATSFEVLEHLYSPEEFLSAVRRILLPQGLLLITTLTVTGFDIQLLWEHSKSVYPPHHINLLSVEGMRRLFERAGFEVLELSTPGELDVDIVRNTVKEDPSIVLPRFIRYLIDDSRTELGASLQRFLQANLLSSHIRVIARKI